MSWTWRRRGSTIDAPVARISNGAPRFSVDAGGPGELLSAGFFENQFNPRTTYVSAFKAHPATKLAVIIVHLERCNSGVSVSSVTVGSTALTVSSTTAPTANRDVMAIAYGVIDPSESQITIVASGTNQNCLYSSYFFGEATTVPEFTLQFQDGTTTPGMVVSFPWNPAPSKQLYMCFHTGRVAGNEAGPEMDIPNGNIIFNNTYIPPYGGARNSGPVYSMFKGSSEATENNQFTLTYNTDGAYDHTFCQFRVE